MQVNPCTTEISLGLGENLQNLTCTYRTATLADCETQTFVECNRVDQLNGDRYVVARHHHIYAFGKSNLTGYVHRTQIELGTVFVVERRVTAPPLPSSGYKPQPGTWCAE